MGSTLHPGSRKSCVGEWNRRTVSKMILQELGSALPTTTTLRSRSRSIAKMPWPKEVATPSTAKSFFCPPVGRDLGAGLAGLLARQEGFADRDPAGRPALVSAILVKKGGS